MQYVIRFIHHTPTYNGLYYSNTERWTGVPLERATKLSHKDARSISGKLRQSRIGLKNEVVEYHENQI